MALAYLDLFADAVATYGALLADGGAPGPDDPRWTIRRRPTLPEPFSKPLQAAFGSTAYRCAMTWQPRVGRGLLDLVDPQLGINGWELRHPSERTKKVTEQGQGQCINQTVAARLPLDSASTAALSLRNDVVWRRAVCTRLTD